MAGSAREGNRGPRSLATLLPALTRPVFRRRSPAAARLMSDWAAIVGPDLAGRTAPRKLNAGVLTLAADGPTALELQHLAAKLAERINVALGEAVVRELRFVRAEVPARPVASGRRTVAVTVEGLPDGSLGEALARLAGAIAGRDRAH